MALETITAEHKYLKQISIYTSFRFSPFGDPTNGNARQAVGEEAYGRWMDLDHILVQLWALHVVRVKVYSAEGKEGEKCEFIRELLPEITKRGVIDLVDSEMPE
jgi:hypothetical protein